LSKGAITKDLRAHLGNEAKNSVRDALKEANKLQKPDIETLFSEVYDEIPKHL